MPATIINQMDRQVEAAAQSAAVANRKTAFSGALKIIAVIVVATVPTRCVSWSHLMMTHVSNLHLTASATPARKMKVVQLEIMAHFQTLMKWEMLTVETCNDR